MLRPAGSALRSRYQRRICDFRKSFPHSSATFECTIPRHQKERDRGPLAHRAHPDIDRDQDGTDGESAIVAGSMGNIIFKCPPDRYERAALAGGRTRSGRSERHPRNRGLQGVQRPSFSSIEQAASCLASKTNNLRRGKAPILPQPKVERDTIKTDNSRRRKTPIPPHP